MLISLDCVLCLARQSLEAARHATDDPAKHEQVLREVLDIVRQRGFDEAPPLIGRDIHRIVRRVSGSADPYAVQKASANRQMLDQLDLFRDVIREADDPFAAAVKLGIAGNSIDNALAGNLSDEFIRDAIRQSLTQEVKGGIADFERLLGRSRSVAYLCDNCGEIVCDRLLIEVIRQRFPDLAITAVVRGAPVINDATMADAVETGLTEIVPVIDNGNDGMGTILEEAGEDFRRLLDEADLIVAKGLANYETLIGYDTERQPLPVVYLFKAKCPFIAQYSGTGLGDLVVHITPGRGQSPH